MGKVILITSREIGQIGKCLKTIKCQALHKEEDNSGVNETIIGDNYLGLFFCDDWTSQINNISTKERAEISEYGINKYDDSPSLSKYAETQIAPKISKKSGSFVFGIFHHYDQGSDTHLYFAEEYPFGPNDQFDEGKQRYLNAILSEIEHYHQENFNNDFKGIEKIDVFSHDKDWGLNEGNFNFDENKEAKQKIKAHIEKSFKALSALLNNNNATIRVFQHLISDDTYLFVLRIMESINNGSMVFCNFDDFKDKGDQQKATVRELLRSDNPDYSELKDFDPAYPIFPFEEEKKDNSEKEEHESAL